jgi:hypothetical protein
MKPAHQQANDDLFFSQEASGQPKEAIVGLFLFQDQEARSRAPVPHAPPRDGDRDVRAGTTEGEAGCGNVHGKIAHDSGDQAMTTISWFFRSCLLANLGYENQFVSKLSRL